MFLFFLLFLLLFLSLFHVLFDFVLLKILQIYSRSSSAEETAGAPDRREGARDELKAHRAVRPGESRVAEPGSLRRLQRRRESPLGRGDRRPKV